MLLKFRIKNYKSFADNTVFTMCATPKQKGLDYSITNIKSKKKTIKALCSSVIYGPNAAGKSNIIGAMDTLRAIVLRGHIKDADEKDSINIAANTLGFIPNNLLKDNIPVEFEIAFSLNDMVINYELVLDIGGFLDANYNRRILQETLKINSTMIFERNDSIKIGDLSIIDEYLTLSNLVSDNELDKIAISGLSDNELFLTNGFKVLYSKDIVKLIVDWFTNRFMTIYRADSMQLLRRYEDPKQQSIHISRTVNEAAALFGANSNSLGYIVKNDGSDAKLSSILKGKDVGELITMDASLFESYGTIRFANIFPLVIKAILTGGTLIVDEFDASIHPMALINIINIFHNDEINVNHAQLIFNTHNSIFLNSNIFRRDEIKFVERNDDTHFSTLYSLSDFGTAGENGVRKNDDYMQHYFVSEYGAIKDIDFTPIFEDLIKYQSEFFS